MKVVKIYGALRQQLGGVCRFEFDVDTPAQALKALLVNFPHIQQWLIDSEKDGVGYRVTLGRERIAQESCELMGLPWSERDVFSITPVIAGAGRGVGQILAGIGLVAFAILAGPAGSFFGLGAGFGATAATATSAAFAGGIVGAGFATAVGMLGVSFLIGGISQLISPAASQQINPEVARLESYGFSGLVNTSQQGGPVPVCYGLVYTGSVVLSAGLDTDNV